MFFSVAKGNLVFIPRLRQHKGSDDKFCQPLYTKNQENQASEGSLW